MRQGLVLIHAGFPDGEAAETTRLSLAGVDRPRTGRVPARAGLIVVLAVVLGVLGAALTAAAALGLATGVPPRAVVIDAGTVGGAAGLVLGGWLGARYWRPVVEPGALVVTATTSNLEEALMLIRRNGGSTIEVLKLDP